MKRPQSKNTSWHSVDEIRKSLALSPQARLEWLHEANEFMNKALRGKRQKIAKILRDRGR
jgi:hypothetical protein